jgi:hypothetical protein
MRFARHTAFAAVVTSGGSYEIRLPPQFPVGAHEQREAAMADFYPDKCDPAIIHAC